MLSLPNVVRPCCREAAALRGARHAAVISYVISYGSLFPSAARYSDQSPI